MKRNSSLALALHTLSHMSRESDRTRTSSQIAEHAGTNPVVVRRVLGKLRKAGLLISEKGHAGGWRLAVAPQDITLAHVYLALEERLVASGDAGSIGSCTTENALLKQISTVLDELEMNLIEKLSSTKISEFSKFG